MLRFSAFRSVSASAFSPPVTGRRLFLPGVSWKARVKAQNAFLCTMSSHPTLIFDLDGCLADTLPDLAAAVNHTLSANGLQVLPVEVVRRMIGNGMPALVERAFAASGAVVEDNEKIEAEVARTNEWYTNHLCVETKLFKGVGEVLDELHGEGWRMGVCTNKPQEAAIKLIGDLEIDKFFSSCVGGDMLPGCKKPNPGHLITALVMAGGEEDQGCIMVGDSHVDVAVARAAGFPVVGCTYGYSGTGPTIAELNPDCLIDCFTELPQALDRWRDDGRDAFRSM